MFFFCTTLLGKRRFMTTAVETMHIVEEDCLAFMKKTSEEAFVCKFSSQLKTGWYFCVQMNGSQCGVGTKAPLNRKYRQKFSAL